MDDWELLERYRLERSQQAFADLVARHAGLVYGVCRRRVRDAHLAEDMAQAVFLLLARRPPRRRGSAALAGWLYQTAVYACMNATRAQRIRDRHEHLAAQQELQRADEDAGGGAHLNLELAEEMDHALARLPAGDRDALLLRYYQGMTVGDVGAALGVSEDTAAKRLSRAIDRLRRALSGKRTSGTLSAAAVGSMLTGVTQASAPPALTVKLAALGSIEAGVVSAVVEQIVSGVALTMKLAQAKLVALIGAVAIVTAGAAVGTVAVVKPRAADTSAVQDHGPLPADAQRRADALTAEAWAMWRRQEYAAAAQAFQQAVDLVPTHAPAWSGLGWSHFYTPDHARAREAFGRCIALQPKHSAALNGLGQLALAAGDTAEAERWFIQCADTVGPAAYGMARICLAQGRWDEARAWLVKVQRAGEYGEDATFKRMLAAAEARKVEDDLRAVLLPRTPAPVTQQLQRGWALMQQGKWDDAEAAFEDAFAQAPDEPDVLSALAWFRFNTGDVAAAQDLFERAVRHDDRHVAAMNGLASVYKRQGRTDDAIALWEKLAERAPQSGVGQFGLAQTYLEQSEFDKALPLFEQLAVRMPGNEAVQSGLERAREGARR